MDYHSLDEEVRHIATSIRTCDLLQSSLKHRQRDVLSSNYSALLLLDRNFVVLPLIISVRLMNNFKKPIEFLDNIWYVPDHPTFSILQGMKS